MGAIDCYTTPDIRSDIWYSLPINNGEKEMTDTRATYVGSCKDSFDMYGFNTNKYLPWYHVYEFSYDFGSMMCDEISEAEFAKNVQTNREFWVQQHELGHKITYYNFLDRSDPNHQYLYIAYDEDDDIHYFFHKS